MSDNNRLIVLDTETTGLDPKDGHRIIEIGCVELVNRQPTGSTYHQYIQPDRTIDEGAIEVHGITNESLADKPRMADLVSGFIDYVRDAELIIHNADFDVGFLNYEFKLAAASWGKLEDYCEITDTLAMARDMRPGQRNSLDALCKAYDVDNTHRELHGALLDAQILADVYLMMTGGQGSLLLNSDDVASSENDEVIIQRIERDAPLAVIKATSDELQAHEEMLKMIGKSSGETVFW